MQSLILNYYLELDLSGGDHMNEHNVPVSAGEQYDVWISSVGGKGDGIARVKGFVLFVSGVAKGDYVKIKVTKVLEKVGFAQLVEKLEKPEGGQPQQGGHRRHSSRFQTMTKEDIDNMEDESSSEQYDDSEDFGEEFVEE
jgi:predicted RNA-binding protein with TRAM domain